jgi:pentatricopeptide repeat protein
MMRKIAVVLLLLLLALYTKGTASFLPSTGSSSSSSNDPVQRRTVAFYSYRQRQLVLGLEERNRAQHLSATAKTSSSSSSSSTQQQQPEATAVAAEDLIEFDEDEFLSARGSNNGILPSYQDYLARMQQLARSTSTDPTAVQQAQDVFDEMLQAFLVTEDSGLWPNTDIYNLLMETHAYSSHPDGAEKVNEILTRMEESSASTAASGDVSINSNSLTPRPNLESYAKLMEAWSRRGGERYQMDNVKAVVDRIAISSSSTNLKPDTYIYNKLIRAYGVAGQPDEARRVLDDVLLKGYLEKDDTSLRPNAKTWTHVLRAYAAAAAAAAASAGNRKRGTEQQQQYEYYLETIQDLMRQMAQYVRRNDEVDWKPGVDAYNALLKCLSLYSTARNTSSSSSSFSRQKQQEQREEEALSQPLSLSSSKEAESVLYGMIEQYRETANDEAIKPNDESFFHVLQAYRGETDAGVAIKVEKLLELQRALVTTTTTTTTTQSNNASSSGRRQGGPSLRTCNAAIAAMSRTRDPQKAMRAQRLVQRMIKENSAASGAASDAGASGDDDDDRASCKPNFTTYRNLLNTCAYSGSEATHTSPEDRLQTFQIAVETLNEIRRQYPHQENKRLQQKPQQQQQQRQQMMDSSIYSLFLRACSNLMPSNRKRDAVIESVFSKCCKDGLVNDAVLREFEKTASEELQVRWLFAAELGRAFSL